MALYRPIDERFVNSTSWN